VPAVTASRHASNAAAPFGATLPTVPSSPDQSSGTPEVDSDPYADWDEIYSDNVVRLYRMMYGKVGNRPDAEDLTGEVFRAALPRLPLGASRADAAKDALVRGGINASRLRTVSYGKEKQFCTEENESCWQQNRRAAFSVDK